MDADTASSLPVQPAASSRGTQLYQSFGSERPESQIVAGLSGLNSFGDVHVRSVISIAVEFLQNPQVCFASVTDISAVRS
jgi:hypothetical protein